MDKHKDDEVCDANLEFQKIADAYFYKTGEVGIRALGSFVGPRTSEKEFEQHLSELENIKDNLRDEREF